MATNFPKRLANLEAKLLPPNDQHFYVHFSIAHDVPENQHDSVKSSLWKGYLRAGGNPNAHGSFTTGSDSKLLRAVGKKEVLEQVKNNRRVLK